MKNIKFWDILLIALFFVGSTMSATAWYFGSVPSSGNYADLGKMVTATTTVTLDEEVLHEKYGKDCVEPSPGAILKGAGITPTPTSKIRVDSTSTQTTVTVTP